MASRTRPNSGSFCANVRKNTERGSAGRVAVGEADSLVAGAWLAVGDLVTAYTWRAIRPPTIAQTATSSVIGISQVNVVRLGEACGVTPPRVSRFTRPEIG